jgi:hypothetical protein
MFARISRSLVHSPAGSLARGAALAAMIASTPAAATDAIAVSPRGTLLPAGSTTVELVVTTPVASEIRWSVGSALPWERMTPAGTGAATTHLLTVDGLDSSPLVVNQIHLRSSHAPTDVTSVAARALSDSTPPFPRVGNLWGSWSFAADGGQSQGEGEGLTPDRYAIDLWLGAHWSGEEIRDLRRRNPHVLVLASMNAVEPSVNVPDSFFLKGIDGERIEVWPGAYRLNLTKPEVVEFQAQHALSIIEASGWMLDGIFIDNVFSKASWFTADIHGNPFFPDADEDGKADDPEVLDSAWRAGLLTQLNRIRELLPNALLTGHAQDITDPVMAATFNGTSIGFDPPYVIEGRTTFATMWNRYRNWETLAKAPRITMVESAVPLQIGYGYGFAPVETMPAPTLEFARTHHRYMRFGLAFTLMGDGWFAHEIGDTHHGNPWWYEELSVDLGHPRGPATFALPAPAGGSIIDNGDFGSGTEGWTLWADASAGASASMVADAGTLRIDIESGSSESWRIDLAQWERPLVAGANYELRFRARASAARPIGIASQKGEPDWRSYGLTGSVQAEEAWRTFAVPFTATESADDARIQFHVGAGLDGDTGPATIWIDDVEVVPAPPHVLRREFGRGLVLLNATNERRTIEVGSGWRRIRGATSPLVDRIIDDSDDGFATTGTWSTEAVDSGEWKSTGPYFHDWGASSRFATSGTATWTLDLPAQDTYTLSAWWPAAPASAAWSSGGRYDILDASGTVVASVELDQRTNGDRWNEIATLPLGPGARVRLTAQNGLSCADAILVRSKARFNDGRPTTSVTLEPMDGLILERDDLIAPSADAPPPSVAE